MPVPPTRGGAVETLVHHLLTENESIRRFDFTVFCIYDKDAARAAAAFSHTRFQMIHHSARFARLDDLYCRAVKKLIGKNATPNRRYIRRVVGMLRSSQWDVIIVENDVLFARFVANAFPGRVWLHLHNRYLSADLDWSEYVLRGDMRVIAVSDFIKRQALTVPGASADRIAVLKNCVDTELFNRCANLGPRSEKRKAWGLTDGDVLFLFAGRLLPEKGVLELINAFLLMEAPGAYLMIVGSSWFGSNASNEFTRALQEAARPKANKILFTGYVPHDQMPEYYAASDIALAPSICEEAAGLTVVEALASGLPLIATDAGGIPEYVDAACAVTVSRGGRMAFELRDAMSKLYADRALRESMGDAGRRKAESMSVGRYFREFERVLAAESRKAGAA